MLYKGNRLIEMVAKDTQILLGIIFLEGIQNNFGENEEPLENSDAGNEKEDTYARPTLTTPSVTHASTVPSTFQLLLLIRTLCLRDQMILGILHF